MYDNSWQKNHLLSSINRHVLKFLYQAYPEKSQKGNTPCQFALGGIYLDMDGIKDKNLTYQSLYEDLWNKEFIEDVLKTVQKEARGKCLY